jgi:hypothetical protein
VDEAAMSTYLRVFAKMRRPSMTPSPSTPQILLEQQDVGRVLGDVGRGIDGDPAIGGVQRHRVVHIITAHGNAPAQTELLSCVAAPGRPVAAAFGSR